jgi:nucleotide-binding universal stress UspA family protein
MSTTVSAPSKVKNILYLTDFSEPSEAALSFATMLGGGYAAKVHALHASMPTPFMTPGLTTVALEAEEENAQAEMQKVESVLAGLEHKVWWKEESRFGPRCKERSKMTMLI